ncbi:MAG: ABC1 kinase family protein [Candidatus Binatia bacterium]
MTTQIISGRALRMWKVGALTTQVGSSYLFTNLLKPFRSVDAHQRELLDTHVRNALRIVESSKELRGTFTKLVQMLSMRDDLFPAEALDVLSVVQSSVPPMNPKVIRRTIEAELGEPPERLFRRFWPDAFAAASLGQVHRAELRGGEPVVVKIQYPGVEKTVEQDLRNVDALLEILTRIAGDVFRHEIDAAEVGRELRERLREELDYEQEARNLRRFRGLFADDEEIEIPEAHAELSTRRVLTMGRIDGYPMVEMLAPGVDRELKDWIAIKYCRTLLRQVLRFGVLHTDPHPGNYLVTYHPHLGILDFGSIRTFPDPLRRAYVDLCRAFLERDEDGIAEACRRLGFLGETEPPGPLISVLECLLEPLLVDREYDPAEYRSIDKAVRAAQTVIENRLFHAPGHRVFLLRALVGLESYVKQLGTVANWRRIFAEEVEAASATSSSA